MSFAGKIGAGGHNAVTVGRCHIDYVLLNCLSLCLLNVSGIYPGVLAKYLIFLQHRAPSNQVASHTFCLGYW
jgi:hypothetical protein